MTFTEKDKEIIHSGNIGKITELFNFNHRNGNTEWFKEAEKYIKKQANKKKVETKTYCINDSKNRHCWLSIGVSVNPHTGTIFQIFKCSQCNKIIIEKLEEITRVYQ